MKKSIFFNWILIALVGFSFIACDNEPLEGEFIVDDGLADGSFQATVDGESFTAEVTEGTMTEGLLIISGTDAGGNLITLTFSRVGECVYDLSSIQNFGAFAFNGDTEAAFISSGIVGGSGFAEISNFNSTDLTVSGSFNFNGVREVIDANGNVGTEFVVVTEGAFEAIPFELVSGNAATVECNEIDDPIITDPILTDPDEQFLARVDGVDFEYVELSSEVTMVGSDEFLKITAINAIGAKFEIFVPLILDVGTNTLQPIFDGSSLVITYNDGLGGEVLTSGSGVMEIQEFGKITGKFDASFEFIGTDPLGQDPTVIEIEGGKVVVDYLPDSGAVPNEFIATIDGEDYAPEVIEITKEPVGEFTVVNLTTINNTENRSVSISFPINVEPILYSMAPFVVVGDEKVGIYNPDIGNSILFKSDETGSLRILSYQYSNGVVEARFSYLATDPLGNDPQQFLVEGSFVITIP